METRWRIWIRNAPGKPWDDPARDPDGGDGSWESVEDAEATAQQLRLQDAAGIAELAAAKLGIDPSELAPRSIEVIVLPTGEQPEDSMEVQTLASGQQIPLP